MSEDPNPKSPSLPAKMLSIEELPVADDRTEAYGILRDAGPVVRLKNGGFAVTTREAADHVFRNPEVFSSKEAFDTLGSPVRLLPIAFDPRTTPATGACSSRSSLPGPRPCWNSRRATRRAG